MSKIQEIGKNSFIEIRSDDKQQSNSLSEVKKLSIEIEQFRENAAREKEELLKLHSHIGQLMDENNELKKTNEGSNNMNEQLFSENMRIKSKLSELSIQFEKQNILCNEYIATIKEFDENFYMFNQFKKMDIETLKSLKGIFKHETIENFIACGSQQENLEALWDFIKYRVMNGQITELELLSDIFRYFLEVYNETSDQQVLKRQIVKIGDGFDVSLHIRTPDGKASGKIGSVYLEGYLNAVTDAIIRKSIVRLDG